MVAAQKRRQKRKTAAIWLAIIFGLGFVALAWLKPTRPATRLARGARTAKAGVACPTATTRAMTPVAMTFA